MIGDALLDEVRMAGILLGCGGGDSVSPRGFTSPQGIAG